MGWQCLVVAVSGTHAATTRVRVRRRHSARGIRHRIHRLFDSQAGMAVHRFEFPDRLPSDVEDYLLEFTTMKSRRDNAYTLDRPLTVRVPRDTAAALRLPGNSIRHRFELR